ncbi:MAG: choice-of-anchor D domain-containing protein, partial [Steroidobacteraceae bacterium]
TLAPASAAFGSVPTGVPSAPQVLVITNTGAPALPIQSITLSGTNHALFSETNNCGTPVAAGATCTIAVVFTPTAAGSMSAVLSVNGGVAGTQTVALNGTGVAPSYTVSPASLAFGSVQRGVASAPQAVTLTNTGTLVLPVTSIAVSGASAALFSLSNGCGTTVAAGATCTLGVVFTPVAIGLRTATLSVSAGGGAGTQKVALSGSGALPAFTIAPTSAVFGSVQTGVASAPQVLTLTNTGPLALPIKSITLSGTNHALFSETSGCGTSVAVGAACTIAVVFTPTVTGSMSATLSVNGGVAGTQSVALSGSGAVPAYTVTPTSLAFGAAFAGVASAPQELTLTNTGTLALPITSISVTGANPTQFSQTNGCGVSVAVGAACTINVVFTPASAGSMTATLSVNGGGTQTQTAALSGTGIVPTYAVSPGALTFGSVQTGVASAPQTVTLTNTSALALPITSIAFSGANAGQFAETDNCVPAVAAGAACSINVVFTPATAGANTASLNVNGGGGAGSQTVPLTGSGVLIQPTYTLSPTSLAFGSVQTGVASAAQTVTLTNTSTLALPIGAMTFSGANAAQFTETDNCVPAVVAGAACSINVVFTPTVTGAMTATLSVNSGDGTAAQTVPLTGAGVPLPQLVQYQTRQTIGNAGHNNNPVQFTSMTTAGDTIWVAVTLSDYAGIHTISVTDTQGNSFQELDQENDGTPGWQTVAHFYASNIAGDTTTPDIVTIVWSNENYKGVLITEIAGTTGAPLVAHSANIQDGLGAGSNNVTSGSITVGAAQTPALLLALSMNTTGGSSDLGGSGFGGPSAGTGFTPVATMWNWGTNLATFETAPVTAAGSVAALFNAPDTDSYVTVAAVFQ